MSIQSAKRKKTLDERADEVRNRNLAVNGRKLSPEQRRNRLRTIRKYLGLSQVEFARIMGLSLDTVKSMDEGRRSVALGYVMLAETYLRRTKTAIKYARKTGMAKLRKLLPAEIVNDVALKTKVLTLAARGKTAEEIAQELVLRPGVVEYFLASMK